MNSQLKNKKRLLLVTQTLSLLLFLIVVSSCKKEITQDAMSANSGININMKGKALATSSTPYDISASLPSGYVKDGSKDYTTYIQKAINAHDNIVFPAFPILVNSTGLQVGSNKTITFLSGSQIIMAPNNNTNYSILTVLSATNVVLNNPTVVGDRYGHLDTLGQWGQGISVRGSSNVTINNATVSNCWGDGIYLAAYQGVGNKNVTIVSPYCIHNRRNGISITNVIGLELDSAYAGYCDGSAPYTGIDIEGETPNDELQGIVLNNPKTEHNLGNGISIGFRSLLGGNNKTIGITINNPTDKSSPVGLNATCTLTRRVGNEVVAGDIIINNPFWRKNTNTPIATNLLLNTIKLTITNPIVQDITGKELDDATILSIFTYKTHINRDANYSITF